MCSTCGCGSGQTLIAGHALRRPGKSGESLRFRALQAPEKPEVSAGQHAGPDYGAQAAGAHAPVISQSRLIRIERDILATNNDHAARNREYLRARGIYTLNLLSSPGSGKTTLLVKTIEALRGALPLAVIEGDQQTENDAARIRAAGAPAVQINTGKGCHLDAHIVGQGMQRVELRDNSLLVIENVGNLVCPAAFDLGEAHKVVILSVTEGEDKPLKYPDMFRAASIMLLNKCDLLPHLEFDPDLAIACARRINPGLKVLRMSATTGLGMPEWLDWIAAGCRDAAAARGHGAGPEMTGPEMTGQETRIE